MMHTEKFDISTNEKRLLHMIKGSKDPKAAADVAIDVIRAFLAPTMTEDLLHFSKPFRMKKNGERSLSCWRGKKDE